MREMLKPFQLELLKEVVDKRCPQVADRVQSTDLSGLTREDRQMIVNALGDEFTASGVGKDWEPTQRGRQLEELIDVVNRPNLQK
jgi:hypothetical protein